MRAALPVPLGTERNLTDKAAALDSAYRLSGVYNLEWERAATYKPELKAPASRVFKRLCHEHNDTDDTRSTLIQP